MTSEPELVLVVGAGPCGIGVVGRLIDLNYKVVWVDPFFCVGRMGEFYREVPANTLNSDLIIAMQSCKCFDFENSQEKRRKNGEKVMLDGPFDECLKLSLFVDSLVDATDNILNKYSDQVQALKGNLVRIKKSNFDENSWIYTVKVIEDGKETEITSSVNLVITTAGCKPLQLNNFPYVEGSQNPVDFKGLKIFSLDILVDPVATKLIVNGNENKNGKWAVIGNSHSGMLIIKNLIEAGATEVVSVFKSPLKFMRTLENGVTKNKGTGLKGPVGKWTKSQIEKGDCPFDMKVYNPEESWECQLKEMKVSHVVSAAGFERIYSFEAIVADKVLEKSNYDNYDRWTGEIFFSSSSEAHLEVKHKLNFFGVGIGYPQNYCDEEGEVEPWVGFHRTVAQVDLILSNKL